MSEPGVQEGGQQLAPRNSLPILLASENQRLPADGPWHCIYKGLYLSITHFWPLPSQDIKCPSKSACWLCFTTYPNRELPRLP